MSHTAEASSSSTNTGHSTKTKKKGSNSKMNRERPPAPPAPPAPEVVVDDEEVSIHNSKMNRRRPPPPPPPPSSSTDDEVSIHSLQSTASGGHLVSRAQLLEDSSTKRSLMEDSIKLLFEEDSDDNTKPTKKKSSTRTSGTAKKKKKSSNSKPAQNLESSMASLQSSSDVKESGKSSTTSNKPPPKLADDVGSIPSGDASAKKSSKPPEPPQSLGDSVASITQSECNAKSSSKPTQNLGDSVASIQSESCNASTQSFSLHSGTTGSVNSHYHNITYNGVTLNKTLGNLILTVDRLVFKPQDKSDKDHVFAWQLDALHKHQISATGTTAHLLKLISQSNPSKAAIMTFPDRASLENIHSILSSKLQPLRKYRKLKETLVSKQRKLKEANKAIDEMQDTNQKLLESCEAFAKKCKSLSEELEHQQRMEIKRYVANDKVAELQKQLMAIRPEVESLRNEKLAMAIGHEMDVGNYEDRIAYLEKVIRDERSALAIERATTERLLEERKPIDELKLEVHILAKELLNARKKAKQYHDHMEQQQHEVDDMLWQVRRQRNNAFLEVAHLKKERDKLQQKLLEYQQEDSTMENKPKEVELLPAKNQQSASDQEEESLLGLECLSACSNSDEPAQVLLCTKTTNRNPALLNPFPWANTLGQFLPPNLFRANKYLHLEQHPAPFCSRDDVVMSWPAAHPCLVARNNNAGADAGAGTGTGAGASASASDDAAASDLQRAPDEPEGVINSGVPLAIELEIELERNSKDQTTRGDYVDCLAGTEGTGVLPIGVFGVELAPGGSSAAAMTIQPQPLRFLSAAGSCLSDEMETPLSSLGLLSGGFCLAGTATTTHQSTGWNFSGGTSLANASVIDMATRSQYYPTEEPMLVQSRLVGTSKIQPKEIAGCDLTTTALWAWSRYGYCVPSSAVTSASASIPFGSIQDFVDPTTSSMTTQSSWVSHQPQPKTQHLCLPDNTPVGKRTHQDRDASIPATRSMIAIL